MIILGSNRYYIEGLLSVLRESTLNRFHTPVEYANIRIYVLSGMSMFRVYQLLTDYPPLHVSVFVLNERHVPAINAFFPKLVKYLVPENSQPETLLRDIISAARMRKFSMLKAYSPDRPNFTPIQETIISFMVNGNSLSDICSTLNISKKTVFAHRYNIYKKMGIKNSRDFYSLWYSLKHKNSHQDIVNIVYTPPEYIPEEETEQ